MSVMCIERFGGAMSEKMRTAKEWLAFGDELAVKLAEVFMPGPWKHNGANVVNGVCDKCGKSYLRAASCPVPDPIVIDWNTAMEWKDRSNMVLFIETMDKVARAAGPNDSLYDSALWTMCFARPKHYLIAAALAEGAKT